MCSWAEGFHIYGREAADLGGCSSNSRWGATLGWVSWHSRVGAISWFELNAACVPGVTRAQSILQQCVPAPHCSSIILGTLYLAVRNCCRACLMGAPPPRLRGVSAFMGDGRSGRRTAWQPLLRGPGGRGLGDLVVRSFPASCSLSQTEVGVTPRLNSDPEYTQKIPEFMPLPLHQIDTEVLTALQMTFVTWSSTVMLHLLKKQNSGNHWSWGKCQGYPCTS